MLSIQIDTMEMLLIEFDFLQIYRADLAGSRTLSFIDLLTQKMQGNLNFAFWETYGDVLNLKAKLSLNFACKADPVKSFSRIKSEAC